MSDIIVELKHVSKHFGETKVLEDINLRIQKGEFVTLLGPSGCGKTTILRLIAGFLKPNEGCVVMGGSDISDTPPHLRPLNTVFQRYALFPHLNVYDNIAFGLKLQKTPKNEIDTKVRKALKMVSMTDYEDRDVESLSGGQQQRVAIARAIVNRPKVLLLDEPLAALDLKMRKDMQIELKEMHKKLGITFIYVTHDQEEALTLSDTVVVLNEGKIQQIGTPADIYNEPVNSFVADFIGESNILNGVMLEDRKVRFIGHDFECIDEGFGNDTPVDVVIRPEDIVITDDDAAAQFTGTVKSCVFKGVHYEMFVNTDTGNEMMIQNYKGYPADSVIKMCIAPYNIQVMKKERVANVFEGEMVSSSEVSIFGGTFECCDTGLEAGTAVTAEVDFNKIDIMDNQEDGVLYGEVHFILYKGNHYHITIKTDDGQFIYADTNDVWDKGDLVGINIRPVDLKITGTSARQDA